MVDRELVSRSFLATVNVPDTLRLEPSMKPNQIAEIRGRLDTIEKLLVQLATELKGIREQLHAAVAAEEMGPSPQERESA